MSGASAQPRPTGALWAPRTAHGAAPGPQRNAPDNPALPPLPAAPVAASGAPAESTPQRGGAPHSSGRSRTPAPIAQEPVLHFGWRESQEETSTPLGRRSKLAHRRSRCPTTRTHQARPSRSKTRTRVCSDARTPRCPANPPGPVLDPSQNSGTPGGPTTARDPPLTSQPPGIHR